MCSNNFFQIISHAPLGSSEHEGKVLTGSNELERGSRSTSAFAEVGNIEKRKRGVVAHKAT